MGKGKFIVLEGIDGSGTTTQAAKLAEYLFKKGFHVFLTREPTGFEIGKEIKRRLKEDKAAGIDPFKEKGEEYARLYVEDRKYHLRKVILPQLKKGVWVVSDRYKYSTFAYQQAQGQELEKLEGMHKRLRKPDMVLIIDVPAEIALERRIGDKTTPELFEELEFQKKVRENYLGLKEKLAKEKIEIIEGSKTVEEVFGEIVKVVERLMT